MILSTHVRCFTEHAPGALTLQAHKAFEDNFWATKMNLTVRARAQDYFSRTT